MGRRRNNRRYCFFSANIAGKNDEVETENLAETTFFSTGLFFPNNSRIPIFILIPIFIFSFWRLFGSAKSPVVPFLVPRTRIFLFDGVHQIFFTHKKPSDPVDPTLVCRLTFLQGLLDSRKCFKVKCSGWKACILLILLLGGGTRIFLFR